MKRTLRVFVIADVHSPDTFSMPELDPDQFDVVFTLGDINEATLDYVSYMSRRVPQYGVPGGHDPLAPRGVRDLHCKVVTVNGIRIGGFGGAPKYKDQRFHFTEKEVAKHMKRMPPVDLFITHTPPLATSMNEDPLHRGFSAFDEYIKRCAPRYWFHGHLERHYKARVHQTIVYGIAWRRPLSLCFNKQFYPPDNTEPRRELFIHRLSWIRRFFRQKA